MNSKLPNSSTCPISVSQCLTPDIAHTVSAEFSWTPTAGAGVQPTCRSSRGQSKPTGSSPSEPQPAGQNAVSSGLPSSGSPLPAGRSTLPAAAFTPCSAEETVPCSRGQLLRVGCLARGAPTSAGGTHGVAGNAAVTQTHPGSRQEEAWLPVGSGLFRQGACSPIRVLTENT